VTGGSYPARIWGAFNTDYLADREPRAFAEPEKTRSGKALRTREDQEKARRAATTTTTPTDGSAPPTGDTTAPPATTPPTSPPATAPPADAEAPGNG
jgi:hypothetical protein